MKVAFVARDVGGFNATSAIARYMSKDGHVVDLHCTRGQRACAEWEKNPLESRYNREIFAWDAKLSRERAKEVLQNSAPNVVIAAMGSPIDIEQTFGLAANDLGIPLIHVSDVWGSHRRSTAKPNLVFVADEYDANLVRQAGNMPSVVGSPLLSTLMRKDSFAEKDFVGGFHKVGQKVILLAGQDGPVTSDCLAWLANSFRGRVSDPQEWVLVPRIHPKFANDAILADLFESSLASIESSGVRVIRDTTHLSADQLARYCDMAVATFSTMLMVASWAGKVAVSVNSPSAQESMMAETGRETWPLVEMACATQVGSTNGTNLNMLLVEGEARASLKGERLLQALNMPLVMREIVLSQR